MVREVTHFVGGKHIVGTSGRFADVFDPSTGEVQARVLLKFLDLIARDMDSLARLLSSEHGKTIADAKGDIQRGVEVIEFAAGTPHLLEGEYTTGAGTGIDVYSMRQPLGVVAGITPFDFPAMIPLWKMGPALAAGKSFILKPSERYPSVPVRIAELFLEAGLPEGVLNVVNGDKEAVDTLLTDDRVKAIGFVGSSPIAQYIYETAAARVKDLKIGHAHDENADYGPLITRDAVDRVSTAIQAGIDEGAELLVDGRGHTVDGYENGFYLGPTLFDRVTPEMTIYKEEVFGPVLIITRADNYQEALRLPSEHEYGNGVSIFTRDGDTARDSKTRVNVGMVGLNVPIPVPIAYHTFGGWKRSGFGDLNQHGPDAFRFYTKTKTVTERWPSGIKEDPSFVIPTMH